MIYTNGQMQLVKIKKIDSEQTLFLNLANMELIKAVCPKYDGDNVYWCNGYYYGHIRNYIDLERGRN
jgi:hypothetical protein